MYLVSIYICIHASQCSQLFPNFVLTVNLVVFPLHFTGTLDSDGIILRLTNLYNLALSHPSVRNLFIMTIPINPAGVNIPEFQAKKARVNEAIREYVSKNSSKTHLVDLARELDSKYSPPDNPSNPDNLEASSDYFSLYIIHTYLAALAGLVRGLDIKSSLNNPNIYPLYITTLLITLVHTPFNNIIYIKTLLITLITLVITLITLVNNPNTSQVHR